ncbi:MAG: acylphosphatase [Halanaerobiales bacterium]|nr:acylphosphatase [Halanaerobiales bacterium]
MDDKVRKHIFISGRVQGVGFRAFTRKNAQQLGVNGWVKNIYDGRVEAVLEGDNSTVKQLESKLKKGPRFANIDNIEVQNETYEGDFSSFSIKY